MVNGGGKYAAIKRLAKLRIICADLQMFFKNISHIIHHPPFIFRCKDAMQMAP